MKFRYVRVINTLSNERKVFSMMAYKVILLILLALTFIPLLTDKKGKKTIKGQLGTVAGVMTIIWMIIGWVVY